MICEKWEGLTVDGRFPLLEWLSGWADRCVFLTVRQGTQKANIKLIMAGGAEAGAHLARWESARALSHPSLVQMMETGRYTIDGSDVVFVLTEKTESILSGIIPRKALDAATVKEILGPVVDALAFLHGKGLAHGCVKPSRIVQVGDEWKLVSDEMLDADEVVNPRRDLDTYDAPELTTGKLTPAADLWSLGIIVIEAFAQRTPVWDRGANGDLGVPDFIPEPFRGIARDCLRWDPEKRLSISDVKSRLASVKAAPVQAKPTVSAEEKKPEPEAIKPEPEKPQPHDEPAKPLPPATASPFEPVADSAADERHAPPLEERWKDAYPGVPERESTAPRSLFGDEEPAELTPRSRLFANLEEDEEPEGRSWTSVIIVFLLIAAGAAGVYYRTEIRDAVEQRIGSTPSQNQPSEQTQTPQPSSPAQSATQPANPTQPPMQVTTPNPSEAQPQSQTAPPENSGAAAAEPGASNPSSSQTNPVPPATSPAPKQESQAAEPGSEQQPATKPTIKARDRAARPQEAPVENGKGAVVKRVMPSVAPGASRGMRGPVDVEVRVLVDEDGRVSDVEYLTQSPGNYFARIAHDAARSWRFRAPVNDGVAKASQWILLFRFGRGHTDVTATEVR